MLNCDAEKGRTATVPSHLPREFRQRGQRKRAMSVSLRARISLRRHRGLLLGRGPVSETRTSRCGSPRTRRLFSTMPCIRRSRRSSRPRPAKRRQWSLDQNGGLIQESVEGGCLHQRSRFGMPRVAAEQRSDKHPGIEQDRFNADHRRWRLSILRGPSLPIQVEAPTGALDGSPLLRRSAFGPSRSLASSRRLRAPAPKSGLEDLRV